MKINYSEKKAYDVKIAYIGGGSNQWAWTLMKDLACEPDISGEVCLYDINLEGALQNQKIGTNIQSYEENKSNWKYTVAKTSKEALTGADFVFISILPGTFDEMESDVHAPEKFGIYQTVGDSTGPGGVIRALRTVPIFADYALQIEKYCPDAWVFNYTNPMSTCTRALYYAFPKIKAFGCCHEVFETQNTLSFCLSYYEGIKNIPRHEISTNVIGVNHFTFIDKATWKGIDLMPLYKKAADEFAESGLDRYKIEHGNEAIKKSSESTVNYFMSLNKVKLDLFKRFGVIAAAGDRHLAEFFPNFYLQDPDVFRNKWSAELTPVWFRKERQAERAIKAKAFASGEQKMVIKQSDEEGVLIMKALLGLNNFTANVNMPNRGQVDDMPKDRIIETNALVTTNEIRPVLAGKLPMPLHGFTVAHTEVHELTVQAAMEKDYYKGFKAFLFDEAVRKIGYDNAEILYREMLNNTKAYLPGFNIK